MQTKTNTIYIKRSTKTNKVRWAVISPYNKTINRGEYQMNKQRDIIQVVRYLKNKYNTTTAYQFLTDW